MGPFASLLPGVREIRAPLAAGYLSLLVLWLSYGGDVPDRADARGLIKRLYELEGLASTLGLAVAISFIAYLLGTLMEWGTTSALRLAVAQRFTWFDYYSKHIAELEIEKMTDDPEMLESTRQRLTRPLGNRWRRAELEIIRTSLMVDHPLIYNDYDRFRAEAELRVAIFIPLTWLVTILGIHFDSAYFLAYFAILGLTAQAVKFDTQATAALVQSVMSKKVSSPFVTDVITDVRTGLDHRHRRVRRKDPGPVAAS